MSVGTSDSAGTRAQIKQVALDLVAAKGFSSATLREIAERMGFTKAALYYHFRSKDELLGELLDPVLSDMEEVLEAADRGAPPEPGSLLRLVLETLAPHREVGNLIAGDPSILSHPDLGPRLDADRRRLVALVAGPEPTPSRWIAATAAFRVVQSVFEFPDTEADVLIEELDARARAALTATVAAPEVGRMS